MSTPEEIKKYWDEWNENYQRDHTPVGNIHIVRNRKGYDYELDGELLNNGTTRPTREPRVASLMASFLRFGSEDPFTLKEAVEANYDAGRNKYSVAYHHSFTSPEHVKEHVMSDWWVKVNVADNLQGAHRWHLKIVLQDRTITVERVGRGVYVFHLSETVDQEKHGNLMTLNEFMEQYHNQFEREGIK